MFPPLPLHSYFFDGMTSKTIFCMTNISTLKSKNVFSASAIPPLQPCLPHAIYESTQKVQTCIFCNHLQGKCPILGPIYPSGASAISNLETVSLN